MSVSKDFKKLNPSASIDEYYFAHYTDVPDVCLEGFVGYIGNSSNPNVKIEIEVDNQYMYENRQVSCCFYRNLNKYNESVIVMTSEFYSEFRSNSILMPVVWHEIGHFHTIRYFLDRMQDGSATKERKKSINNNELSPEEQVADLFAVYYTSKDDVIEFLNYMIKRRRNKIDEPVEIKDLAIAELCRRKRLIREFDCSEENIRKTIAKLCGKEDFYTL